MNASCRAKVGRLDVSELTGVLSTAMIANTEKLVERASQNVAPE